MSKERARRREEREAQAAVRAQERAVTEKKAARKRARKEAWTARLAWFGPRPGQQTGIVAARRRLRLNLVVTVLVLVQVFVWFAREDWQASLAALVVSVLAFPVIALFVL